MKQIDTQIKKLGNMLVDAFQLLGLFVIGATVVWAAVHEYLHLIEQGRAGLDDILLLFIYLELGAMVGIYFKSGRIPAQFLLFVAITVLTRMLTSLTVVEMSDTRILVIVGAILLLCIAVFVLRYTEAHFGPTKKDYWLT